MLIISLGVENLIAVTIQRVIKMIKIECPFEVSLLKDFLEIFFFWKGLLKIPFSCKEHLVTRASKDLLRFQSHFKLFYTFGC